MATKKKPDEDVKAEIEEGAALAKEIAGPAVEAAATDEDPDEVRIVYDDGRTAKVSKPIAEELVARGRASLSK